MQRPWSNEGVPDDRSLRAWVEAALEDQPEPVEVLIRIVGETESRQLNHRYRGVGRPTNVLAFPMDLPNGVPHSLLGDVIICAPVVLREAKAQAKTPQAHWAHIVIHGVLHLLGYDHQGSTEAQVMEQRESSILARIGYPDPYGECAQS